MSLAVIGWAHTQHDTWIISCHFIVEKVSQSMAVPTQNVSIKYHEHFMDHYINMMMIIMLITLAMIFMIMILVIVMISTIYRYIIYTYIYIYTYGNDMQIGLPQFRDFSTNHSDCSALVLVLCCSSIAYTTEGIWPPTKDHFSDKTKSG